MYGTDYTRIPDLIYGDPSHLINNVSTASQLECSDVCTNTTNCVHFWYLECVCYLYNNISSVATWSGIGGLSFNRNCVTGSLHKVIISV